MTYNALKARPAICYRHIIYSSVIAINRVGGIFGAFSRDFGCSFFLPTLYIVSIVLMYAICSVYRVGGYLG